MVVNGSLSKTAVNGAAGARTQLSGLVVAALTVVTLLFLTGLFEDLPEATLGAVVIAALIELVDVRALVGFYRLYTARLGEIYGVAARPDFIAAVAAHVRRPDLRHAAGSVHRHRRLAPAAPVPRVASARRGARPGARAPPISTATSNAIRRTWRPPGIVVLRVEGGLFFANAEAVRATVRDRTRRAGHARGRVRRGDHPVVDVSAVTMLAGLSDDLRSSGVRLVLAHDTGQVRDLFRAAEAEDLLADVYPSVQAAIDAVS